MAQLELSEVLQEVLACRESLQQSHLRLGSRSKAAANIRYNIERLDGLIAMLRDTSLPNGAGLRRSR
jgi:hypothetical protein